NGPSNTFGTAVIAKVMPTSRGPYWATRKASATWWTRSPKRLTSWPTQSSEKFALRANRRYGDCARSRTATPAPAAGAASGGEPIGPAGASWAGANARAYATPVWNSPAVVGRSGLLSIGTVARTGALGRVMDETIAQKMPNASSTSP